MATEFDMKGGYKIVENAILIDSTPAGVSLYSKSKEIIFQNARSIDSNVSLMKMCDILLQLIDSVGREKTEFTQNIHNWRNFLNCACLIASFDIDFSISTRELMNAKNLPEQMYYIKAIYIHLYRYLERITNEFGVIKPIASHYGLLQEYKISNKAITDFSAKHYFQIKDRRNKLYAHIKDNKNYLEYQKDCVEMKMQVEVNMCIEFLNASSLLNVLLGKLFPILTFDIIEMQQKIVGESQDANEKFSAALDKVRQISPEMAEQLELKVGEMKQKVSDSIAKLLKRN